jgi:hypothetical protein
MNEPKLISKNGKSIIYIDFSGLQTKEAIYEQLARAKQTISTQLPKSALTLTNITGMYFNTEIFNAFTKYAKDNDPYVKASAVIGMNGMMQIFYNGFSKISGREVKAFNTEEDAINYLTKT